jgi:hypothetical protein
MGQFSTTVGNRFKFASNTLSEANSSKNKEKKGSSALSDHDSP